MPKSPLSISHAEAKEAIEGAYKAAYREIRIAAKKQLALLDAADPKTLPLTVNALLKANFDQKAIAKCLGVSRPTVSRWAKDLNIPRSAAFRKWAVDTLRNQLGDSAGNTERPALQ
jgi:DNA-binding transcriptional regulator YiaG